MYLPPDNSQKFAPPPAGAHPAICYRVIDLGTQTGSYKGAPKRQHKILLSWELPTELIEEGEKAGEPFTVHQRYTFSSSEKSRLRQDLESWRGKAFQDSDFGPGGFDIKNVLGVPCLLGIIHETKDGNTYANVRTLSRLPKGMAVPQPVNPQVYFAFDIPDWMAIYEGFSDGLKATISRSPEYAEAVAKRNGTAKGEPVGEAPPARDDMSDDIPF